MASFLANFSFSKLFGNLWQKNQSVLGIDIGTSSIKIIQLKKKGGHPVLETYGELSLGPYAGLAVGQATNLGVDKISEALKDLFREANVTGKLASISLPLRSSLLTVMELPAYQSEHINTMVPLEARKYIPVPISEVTLDWWVIPKHEFRSENEEQSVSVDKQKTEILLVAIHKSAMKKYQDITKMLTTVEARTFEIETFSSIRSVLSRDISAMALLDVGASTSKLTIVDYGIVRVSHVINKGSQDITMAIATAKGLKFEEGEKEKRKSGLGLTPTAGSILDYIFFEAAQTIEEYQKHKARLVGKVVCTGGGASMPGFLALAQKHFQAEVTLGKPFDKVETPAFLAGLLAEAGPEFAVALGLAIHELGEL